MPVPSGPLPANVLDALRRGRKIEAVRLLRLATRGDLKECREAIDDYLDRNGGSASAADPASLRATFDVVPPELHISPGAASPGEVPRSRVRFIEIIYVIASILPLLFVGLIVAQTEGSLVSGYALGAMIPLLALISLILVLTGIGLILFAYRRQGRVWHLVLATAMSSPFAILLGLTLLFG